MTKKKKPMDDLPTMTATLEQPEVVETVTPMQSREQLASTRADYCNFSLPYIRQTETANFQDEARRCDLKGMTRDRMAKLKAIRRGMIADGYRLANGDEVRTNSDVFYCWLDNMKI